MCSHFIKFKNENLSKEGKIQKKIKMDGKAIFKKMRQNKKQMKIKVQVRRLKDKKVR
jgi:hypothetical protein